MSLRSINFRGFIIIAAIIILTIPAFSERLKLMTNEGFTSVKQILVTSCTACHSWPGSYKDIVNPDRVVPFHPEQSQMYIYIEDDTMPMSGPKLTRDKKNLIRAWIEAGATDSNAPLTESASGADASTPDIKQNDASIPEKKLPGSIVLHAASGFTSAGLFLAGGIVSTVHFFGIMSEGHALEESGVANESNRGTYMMNIWNEPAQQTLRWWHVGLISTGEALYLYNVITGIGMWSGDQPGLSREKLHRYGFFLHSGLMVAQIILGFLETYALQTGNHEIHVGIGVAHCAIGFAIPIVMVSAGLENILR